MKYKQLFLDWIRETVDYGKGPRSRIRFPGQYEQFEAIVFMEPDENTLWFTSDLHFNHANVIKYSNRPFIDRDEMNDELIRLHNKKVHPLDHVIYVGDIAFCSDVMGTEFVDRLNGEVKHLVIGNHDLKNKKAKQMGFEKIPNSISLLMVIEYEEFIIIVSHFPLGNLPSMDNGRYVFNVHGHTHEREEESIHHISVCVERTNYMPVSLGRIEKIIESRITELEG